MTAKSLEERVSALERMIVELNAKIEEVSDSAYEVNRRLNAHADKMYHHSPDDRTRRD
jgi:prefoldin subunit 5